MGVPARVVRGPHVVPSPRAELDHGRLPDPIAETCRQLSARIQELDEQLITVQQSVRHLEPAGVLSDGPVVEVKQAV